MEPITTLLTTTIAGNLVMGILGDAIYDVNVNKVANFWNNLNLGNHDLQKALDEAYKNTFASLELVLTKKEGLKKILDKFTPKKKAHQELAQDFAQKVLDPFLLKKELTGKKRDNFFGAARLSCQFMQKQRGVVLNYEELFQVPQATTDQIEHAPLMNKEARETFTLIESILFVGQDLSDAPDLSHSREEASSAIMQRLKKAGGAQINEYFSSSRLPEYLFFEFLQEDNLLMNGLVYNLDLTIKNNQKVANIIQEYRAQSEKVDREKEKQTKIREHQELNEKITKVEQAIQLMKDTGADISSMHEQLQQLQQNQRQIKTLMVKTEQWTTFQQDLRSEINTFESYFGDVLEMMKEMEGKIDDVLVEVRKLNRDMGEVVTTTKETKEIVTKTGGMVSAVDNKVDFIIDLLQGFRQDTVLSDHLREGLVAGLEPAESFDIHNNYDFEESARDELGRGAVGVVYQAVHKGTKETCALKLLKREYRNNTTVVARFLREGTILKGVQHPNIVRVEEVGGGGKELDFYIHMELLKGSSLRKLIDEKLLARGWDQLLSITCQLCEGLEIIHRNGIIHRDLNPNNIMITPAGDVKLMDFGVAKIVGLSGLTLQGEVVGTSKYMSPEQERGKSVDFRTDIYSLGLVLYELYTYRKPEKPPKSIRFYNSTIPEWVDTVIHQCLAPEKEDRFPSITKLKKVVQGEGADPVDKRKYKTSVSVFLEDGKISKKEAKMLKELQSECALPDAICRQLEQETHEEVFVETIQEAEQALQEGDNEEAVEQYTIALRMKPDRDDVRQKLKQLGKGKEEKIPVYEQETRPPVAEPSKTTPVVEPSKTSSQQATIPQIPVAAEKIAPTDTPWNDWQELVIKGATRGHTADVTSVFITADNKTVISCGNERTIRFWDIEDGKEKRILAPPISGHIISPSLIGKDIIVSTTGSNVGLILDADNGTIIHRLTGQQGIITSLCLSKDNTLVASGSVEAIRIWDVESGKELKKLSGHNAVISSLLISSDNRYLISASHDKTARVWDIEKSEEIRKFEAEWLVISACISSDNKLLIAGAGLVFYVWDVIDNQLLGTHRVGDGSAQALTMSLSPDNHFLVIGGSDKIVYVLQTDTWQEIKRLEGHTGQIKSVAISPDNKTIVSGSADKSIRAWDIDTGQQKWELVGHTGPVKTVRFSPDNNILASGSDDFTIRLWRPAEEKEIASFCGHNGLIQSIAFSSDGKYIASGGFDGLIYVWDVKKEQMVSRFSSQGMGLYLSFSRDDKHIVAAVTPAFIRIWDWQTKTLTRNIQGEGANFRCACLSTDNNFILTGSADKQIRQWDFQTGELIQTFVGHISAITALDISRDGQLIVSGDSKDTIYIWETQSGKSIQSLRGHKKQITSLLITPDNKYVVSASQDKTIRFWDIESGQPVKVFDNHVGSVWSMDLSSDNRFLVSGSDDKTVRLWGMK